MLYAVWARRGARSSSSARARSRARAARSRRSGTTPRRASSPRRRSAPSLADLDANAGNYLLGNARHQAAAHQAFEKRRASSPRQLVDAAENITYGEAEDGADQGHSSTASAGTSSAVAEMRYRKDTGDAAGALGTYGAATDMMHRAHAPRGRPPRRRELGHLDDEYKSQQEQQRGAPRSPPARSPRALVAALVWAQSLPLPPHAARLQRPPLVAATVRGRSASASTSCDAHRRRARRISASRRTTPSTPSTRSGRREPSPTTPTGTRPAAARPRARRRVRRRLPRQGEEARHHAAARTTPCSPRARSRRATRASSRRSCATSPSPGEREAAIEMIRAFAAYDRIDGEDPRARAGAASTPDAVELCIGTRRGSVERGLRALRRGAPRRSSRSTTRRSTAPSPPGSATSLVAGGARPSRRCSSPPSPSSGIRPRLREYAA